MFKLLNRFAWLISISIWFTLSWHILRLIIWYYDYSSNIVLSVILAFAVKKVFLSRDFIEERVRFFAKKLWGDKNKKEEKLSKFWKVMWFEDLKEDDKKENAEEIEIRWLEEENIKETMLESIEIREEKNIELKNKKEFKKEEYVPSKVEVFFTKAWDSIKNFFKENLLAKLWWALIFLWVLFFLNLIYSAIWPVWKLVIGFIVGFWIYLIWVWVDKKWLKWESRVLLWIWILINYLVILSWRYLIWDSYSYSNTMSIWLLSTSTTFLFLILNTVFGTLTSLFYRSSTLLIFSFIFAYLNPFLLWWSSDTPYILSWYSLIVSFWALYLWINQKSKILTYMAFIFWNILLILAPFNSEIWWIAKLVSSAILWITTLISIYNSKQLKTNIWNILIINYIFLILLLVLWWKHSGIIWNWSFIFYMIYIIISFLLTIFLFIKTTIKWIIYILAIPLLIVLWISISWLVGFVSSSLAIITIVYLVGFLFLKDYFKKIFSYVFFIMLWIFIFSMNSINNAYLIKELWFASFITTIITSFVFIITAYFFSRKEKLEYLYTIWTIWWILTLSPIIYIKSSWSLDTSFVNISAISVILFAIMNWSLPFINKNVILSDIKNLVVSSVIWIMFISVELFRFGQEYFPWISLWIVFLWIAIIYFVLWYIMMSKIELPKKIEEDSINIKDGVMSYLAISISLFSFAIALIFSNHPEIISTAWLLEATVLFYFYNRKEDIKIYILWIILFFVWISKLFLLVDVVAKKEFIFLISFSIIFISLVTNIKLLDNIKKKSGLFVHNIWHILWIFALSILIQEIIPSTGHGWSILWASLFLLIIWSLYAYFKNITLKYFFIVLYIIIILWQIWDIKSILYRLEKDDLEYLKSISYISTLILSVIPAIWSKINKENMTNVALKIIFSIYILIIVSHYIYDIFNNTFAITIFWWVIASLMVIFWIQKDKIKYRTSWLYLIWLVSIKIFLYDIWYSIDDAVVRVLALMIIWWLYIAISIIYSKKYGNNLKWEFNLSNITWKTNKTESNQEAPKKEEKFSINEKIENISVEKYKSAKFKFSDWKEVQIRAVNLLKIVIVITSKLKKQSFEKWELKDYYDYIVKNYKSDLSKDNYEKIKELMKKFVEKWGSVELIEK